MTTPADRGWGNPGAPGSATGTAYRTKNIVKITPAGLALWVHRGVATLFTSFINEIAWRGYVLDNVADDWGYAHRYIRGSTTALSNHSWGLAIDLNATTNPMTSDGRVHTDMPSWVVAVASKYGFFWGGNYSAARKDPMHFEFLGTWLDAGGRTKALTTQYNQEVIAINQEDSEDMTPEQFKQHVALQERQNTLLAEINNRLSNIEKWAGEEDAERDKVQAQGQPGF